jgi:hypothetical protein
LAHLSVVSSPFQPSSLSLFLSPSTASPSDPLDVSPKSKQLP